jgi:hypothetical protein
MPEIPLNLYYPLFVLLLFAVVICFIPKEKYRSLFWMSLLWGFFACHLSIIILGKLFNLFHWEHTFPFDFLYAPFFIKLAWFLAMMIYFYFLPERTEWYVLPLYIFMFSFVSAALDWIFHQMGLLTYFHWSPFIRFLVAIIWFYLATIHYRSLNMKET